MARKKGANYFSVVFSMSLVVFLLFILGALLINTARIGILLKENIQLITFLELGSNISEAKSIDNRISSLKFVKSTKLIDGDKAFEEFKKNNEENYGEFFEDNPLPHSIEISLIPSVTDQFRIEEIQEEIQEMKGVSEVSYPSNVVQKIERNKTTIIWWIGIIASILVLVSVIVIYNTVKLDLYSKRFEIKSMQLVGARNLFIVTPFLKKAFLNGLIAILIGVGMGWALYYIGFTSISGITSNLTEHVTFEKWVLQDLRQYIVMFTCLILITLLVVLLSTFVVSKKFLNQNLDKLY